MLSPDSRQNTFPTVLLFGSVSEKNRGKSAFFVVKKLILLKLIKNKNMANFAKKLEEATEEELYSWVNELDPNFVKLASDELTRRAIGSKEKNKIKIQKKTPQKEWYEKLLGQIAIIIITGIFVSGIVYFLGWS